MNHRISSVGETLAAYNGDARRDAELLLAHCLQRSRATLLARPELSVSNEAALGFAALMQRRVAGEPVAYLIGEKEFWSLPLKVTRDVLVPRPDTELLVATALEFGDRDSRLSVADLGTGSGAIALALASERPRWNILATDASEAALAVARDNAGRLGLTGIEFCLSDWFEALAGRRFDVIVANPPYIATGDAALAAPELRFEPRMALIAGPTGLEALALLAASAPHHLNPRGRLVLEHGFDQAKDLRGLLATAGFSTIRTHRDLAGHERVTSATSPE
jgi:release factor glutamine methyltransferase